MKSSGRGCAFALVKSHSARLAEHFDAVQVFVTKKTEDGTTVCSWGDGNWYARYGQVKAWIVAEEGKMASGADG